MDLLEKAAVERARAALSIALPTDTKAHDFALLTRARLASGGDIETAEVILAAAGKSALVPFLKADVDGGGTESWGSQLEGYDSLSEAFLESLRGRSLYDTLVPASRRLPSRVRIATVTEGMEARRTHERGPAPATSFALAPGHIEPRKVSGIAVFSKEILAADGSEAFISRELQRAVAAGTDSDFIAEITESTTPSVASTGATAAHILAAITTASASMALHSDSQLFLGVSPVVCAAWSLLDSEAFKELTPNGGSVRGIQVIPTDGVAEDEAVLVDGSNFVTSSDDRVIVARSTNATVDARNAFEGGTAKRISLFQGDLAGVLVTRHYGFHMAHADSVALITGIAVPEASS